jgi:fermentation-respiration switch protein FrsA (DUF1100 family)
MRLKRDHRIGLDLLHDLERNRARFDVAARCAGIRAPVLLVHGTADESVEFESMRRLEASLPAGGHRALAIEGAGHTFGATHPLREIPPALERAMEETGDWFVSNLA